MSFTGDLEHLPIVDIIQLLHATRKSGTLGLHGPRSDCQLVFRDGYLISANHANSSLRLGRVLVEMQAISGETLREAVEEQERAGDRRQPLLATLLETGKLRKEDALKGLESLIELTIVEVLNWEGGTFSLDVDQVSPCDEYRYFPEKLQQEFSLDAQSVLMEALRIYDEKKRDGELGEEKWVEEDWVEEEVPLAAAEVRRGAELKTGPGREAGRTISADDLGLADLDRLERKIPAVFSSLADPDPAEGRRQKLGHLPLSAAEQEELLALYRKISEPSASAPVRPGGAPQAVILFSADAILCHSVAEVCRQAGGLVFTTEDEGDLDPIIDQSLAKSMVPVLVFDSPGKLAGGVSEEKIGELRRQKKEKYPLVSQVQLVPPRAYEFSLQALGDGALAVLPRPSREERPETFIADIGRFLGAFRCYLKGIGGRGEWLSGRFAACLARLATPLEPAEVTDLLLRFVADLCERAMTLVVGRAELIAEKGVGIEPGQEREPAPTAGFRIPLTAPSLFTQVIREGNLFYGKGEDAKLQEQLFPLIGAPADPTLLLLPLRCHGRTVSFTYGDFGRHEAEPLPLDFLEILAGQAGLVLENFFLRKRLETSTR